MQKTMMILCQKSKELLSEESSSTDEQLYIIDWHTADFDNYGDPWYEFNRLGTEFPAFASGQIDGYFNSQLPEEFWKLLSYYLTASAITSIVWSKYFVPERLDSIIKLNKDILSWSDNLKILSHLGM